MGLSGSTTANAYIYISITSLPLMRTQCESLCILRKWINFLAFRYDALLSWYESASEKVDWRGIPLLSTTAKVPENTKEKGNLKICLPLQMAIFLQLHKYELKHTQHQSWNSLFTHLPTFFSLYILHKRKKNRKKTLLYLGITLDERKRHVERFFL